MNYKFLLTAFFLMVLFFACGKTDKPESENKQENQNVPVSGKEVTVEIHTSGMTCTGCESTIKKKVKKVEGVKDVIADFQTNTVKATYDDGKTNVEAIKEAISSAGYKVESVQ